MLRAGSARSKKNTGKRDSTEDVPSQIFCAGGERKELNTEVLTDEAIKLLELEIDALYATLGAQLLGQNFPARTASIVSYISALRSAAEAKSLYQALPSLTSMEESGTGLRVIYEELKQDGMRYFSEVTEDLRKAVCKEDIFRLTDTPERSSIEVVVTLVAAALRMPPKFDPIAVTVSAILLKLGLRNFCR